MAEIIQLGPDRNEAYIIFCSRKAKIGCDRKCFKAWGTAERPRKADGEEYRTDNELPLAPACPDTAEGRDIKPGNPDKFPNKWCIRQCERSAISEIGKHDMPLELPDFD